MTRKLTHCTGFLLLGLLLAGCTSPADAAPMAAKGKLPEWAVSGELAQYPKAMYWTAPGSGADLMTASDKARSQVAAQLQVQIKSVTTSTESEFTGGDRDYYRSAFENTVQSLVDASVRGIEIARTEKSGNTYYAFAVLDKETYLGGLRRELEDFTEQLRVLYEDAERMFQVGDIFPAIENLADAMLLAPEVYPRQNYYNALSDMNFNLPSNLQGAALLSHIRSVLSTIQLELVNGSDQSAAPGQRLPKPISVRLILKHAGRNVPIEGLPLRASYASGDQAGKVVTDDAGMANLAVSAVPGDRPDAGWVRIVPNLGRMPEIMAPQLKTLELVVSYRIAGEIAAFAVSIKSVNGKRLSEVESDVEATVLAAGFRIDPQSKMILRGVVSSPSIRKIEVGGSPTFQAETSLRLEVYDLETDSNKGSLEVTKKTVNKNEKTARQTVQEQVGKSVKRKALTEMLADALAR